MDEEFRAMPMPLLTAAPSMPRLPSSLDEETAVAVRFQLMTFALVFLFLGAVVAGVF
jgi:hypothetical protein